MQLLGAFVIRRVASMEPPPIGGGNTVLGGEPKTGKSASMEPPPIGGGNVYQQGISAALKLLQWSRLQSEAVIWKAQCQRPA